VVLLSFPSSAVSLLRSSFCLSLFPLSSVSLPLCVVVPFPLSLLPVAPWLWPLGPCPGAAEAEAAGGAARDTQGGHGDRTRGNGVGPLRDDSAPLLCVCVSCGASSSVRHGNCSAPKAQFGRKRELGGRGKFGRAMRRRRGDEGAGERERVQIIRAETDVKSKLIVMRCRFERTCEMIQSCAGRGEGLRKWKEKRGVACEKCVHALFDHGHS
jgi:hypothetical protein